MSDIAIKFENISKQYRLGLVSTRTLSHDLNRWWQTTVLKKEDPYLRIGESNDRSKKGESDYVWALKNIDFEVKKGEVLGIIGKNGAGKSTLLKILSRVTTPTTGIIKADGRIASLLEVGTGFHSELTGRENIYMNGSIMGMNKTEINRKLDEIVNFAGVARYIDTPVKRYSSGMIVRLGFSVAAHLEPEILVVDEVLAVGDAEFQNKAIGKMQDVSKGEGRTVLFVSHNMSSMRQLCQTGLVLNNGEMAYQSDISSAINFYENNSKMREDEKIINHIKRKHSSIEIESITVNNSEYSVIDLKPSENMVELVIKGFLKEPLKLAPEMHVYDSLNNPLAYFNLCLSKGFTPTYESGPFEIKTTMTLPEGVVGGNYKVNIFLTNPNINGYVDIVPAFELNCEGYITESGFSLNYGNRHGWLFLR